MKELDEQVNTVERALGECMIGTAEVVLRSWLNELGEKNPYEEALRAIRKEYDEVFTKWLNINDPDLETTLDRLTGDAYQLADAIYADLRLKRGLSPQMHGFNPDSPQSVIHYFHNCIQMKPEDLDWLRDVMNDEERMSAALIAITSLARNLRECFSIDAFTTLIEGMCAENDLVADQCIADVMSLLIHYDLRIDFFPQIQEAFTNAVSAMDDQGEHVFEVLLTWIEMSKNDWLEEYATGLCAMDWMPKQLQKLVEAMGLRDDYQTFLSWVPKAEKDYMAELVNNLPHTWLYEVLISGNAHREHVLVFMAVQYGYRDYMWMQPEAAEQMFKHILRDGTDKPIDYINYAHCLLMRGDRMMAYENYKQARQLSGSLRDFYELFRPDRRQLVEHGVPLDDVYLIEDNLING